MVVSVTPVSLSSIDHPLHRTETFLQQRWVQNVLPLATSVFVHLAILAAGIALYQVVTTVKPVAPREQMIIPASDVISKADLPTGIVHANMTDLKVSQAMQDEMNLPPDGAGTKKRRGLSDFPSGNNNDDPAFMPAVSAGGAGMGSGDPFGGNGAGYAPFGPPHSGGNPEVRGPIFHGHGNRMVFLCDASGSMISVFGALKENLRSTVKSLDFKKNASFNIIFFNEGNCLALFSDGVQPATDENKHKAMEFIDNAVSVGGTQPLPAIKFALAEKPDLLFVLTDGFDQVSNFDDVVKTFRDGNRDNRIQINTIFLESDSDPQLERVLKQIANDARGEFTKIRKQDM